MGTWRRLGVGPSSSLICFRFTADSLEGEELRYEGLGLGVEREKWVSICPARGLCVQVQSVDARMAALRIHSSSAGDSMRHSPSAEAVAAVALGSSPLGSSPLGSSPLGSFELELQQFMTPLVQNRRRQRRREKSQRSPGQSQWERVALEHLERVVGPLPSSRHPLVGLWLADFGPAHGVQVLKICMDFTRSAARLLAWGVAGDALVPAGRLAWCALASPMPQPWSPAEQDRIAEAQERWLEEEGAWQDEEELRTRQVSQVHMAWGQEGGPVAEPGVPPIASLAEARLWVFSPDRLVVWWVGGGHDVAKMRRIDADFVN